MVCSRTRVDWSRGVCDLGVDARMASRVEESRKMYRTSTLHLSMHVYPINARIGIGIWIEIGIVRTSKRARSDGKMRDPGNEVEVVVPRFPRSSIVRREE